VREELLRRRALLDGGWQELPIEAHHALAVAQASAEGVLLITSDQQLSAAPRIQQPASGRANLEE